MANLKVKIHVLRRACTGFQNEEYGLELEGVVDPQAASETDPVQEMAEWLYATANTTLDRQQVEVELRLKAQAERLNGNWEPARQAAPAAPPSNGGGYQRNSQPRNGGGNGPGPGNGERSYQRAARQFNGPPTSGKQLFAWARKKEEAGQGGLVKQIADWGNQNGIQGRITDWGRDEAQDAYQAFGGGG